MTHFDLIWTRLRTVLAFLGGLGIMVYETVADHSDRPWLYAAAVGMMGLPLARTVEGVLTRFSNSEQPNKEPEPKMSDPQIPTSKSTKGE